MTSMHGTQQCVIDRTYTDYVARIEHEDERHRVPLIVDVAKDAYGADDCHDLLDFCRGQHAPLKKIVSFHPVALEELIDACADRNEVDWSHEYDSANYEVKWDLSCAFRPTIESVIDPSTRPIHALCESL